MHDLWVWLSHRHQRKSTKEKELKLTSFTVDSSKPRRALTQIAIMLMNATSIPARLAMAFIKSCDKRKSEIQMTNSWNSRKKNSEGEKMEAFLFHREPREHKHR